MEEFSPVNESDRREGEDERNDQVSDPTSGVSGVIVGEVVPQDVEVISPEMSSNDGSHDERSGVGNDDPNIDSHEEIEGGDVVVVGTIPCPPRQGEQPVVYFRRPLKLQSHIPLQTPLHQARQSQLVMFLPPLSM